MEQRIKGILLGTVIGDSLGTPLDGLSRGHIQTTFKNMDTYLDPLPALKGRINTWRKPGLYSSISQMLILISSLSSLQKKGKELKFIELIKNSPEIGENKYSIFRHPGSMERNLIERIKYSNDNSTNPVYSSPCARLTPIISPGLLYHEKSGLKFLFDILSFSKLFNQNYFSIAGALSFGAFLRRLIHEDSNHIIEPLSIAIEETEILQKEIHENSPSIFELKINPYSLEEAVKEFIRIYYNIAEINDKTTAEESIYKHVSKFLKTPIKRATVNHSLSIIPYSIHLAKLQLINPHTALFSSLREGGTTSVLCSLTGSIMGAALGMDCFPDSLIQEMVNKKKIIGIINILSNKSVSDGMIDDFINSEIPLTIKEIEELNAKIKHWKPKAKKKKSRMDRETELSRHIVESWTKTDKAKWKKKKEKLDKHRG